MLVAVADEGVGAVPLVDAEIGVEVVRDGEPRDMLPAHPLLQPLDVGLRRAGNEGEGGVAGVQMGGMRDLVGDHRAAAAGMVGPAEHPGLEEGAVDDQLAAAVEQVEQARLAVGSFELIGLLHGQPRHPPAIGGERVPGSGHFLFLHQQLLACRFPLLL